jgi:threonine aldolase
VGALGLDSDEALARLADQGVGLSLTPHPGVLRALTHLDVDDEDVDAAIDRIPKALGVLARA